MGSRRPTPKGHKRCSRCKGDYPEKSYPVRKEFDDGSLQRYSTCPKCTDKIATRFRTVPYAVSPDQLEQDKWFRKFLRIQLRRAA